MTYDDDVLLFRKMVDFTTKTRMGIAMRNRTARQAAADVNATDAQGGKAASNDEPLPREHLLVFIADYPDGMRQKELARIARINASSASEIIGKLENDGYVERLSDPLDKRAVLVKLTEAGWERAAEMKKIRAQMGDRVFRNLTAQEKQALRAIIDKLLLDE